MAWSTSTRAARLPPDWPNIRTLVKQRARGRCQASEHHPDCNRIGTDVDHIEQGDNHALDNLQLLSGPCHRAKTARETAERNRARAAMRRRPQEQHPGAL